MLTTSSDSESAARRIPVRVPPPSPRPHRRLRYVIGVLALVAVSGVSYAIGTGTADQPRAVIPHEPRSVSYTPQASTLGGSLQMPAVWSGLYIRRPGAKVATLTLHAQITGNWSGTGVLELSLPPGWQAAAHQESAAMTGFAAPVDSVDLHAPLIGVLHAGARKLRIIAPATSGTTKPSSSANWWLALDGVNVPFHFTAPKGKQPATLDLTGQVILR